MVATSGPRWHADGPRRAVPPRPARSAAAGCICRRSGSFSKRSQASGAAAEAPRAGRSIWRGDPRLHCAREILEGDACGSPRGSRLGAGRERASIQSAASPRSTGGGSAAAMSSAASATARRSRLVGPEIGKQPVAIAADVERVEIDAPAARDPRGRPRAAAGPLHSGLSCTRRGRVARRAARPDRSHNGRAGD